MSTMIAQRAVTVSAENLLEFVSASLNWASCLFHKSGDQISKYSPWPIKKISSCKFANCFSSSGMVS